MMQDHTCVFGTFPFPLKSRHNLNCNRTVTDFLLHIQLTETVYLQRSSLFEIPTMHTSLKNGPRPGRCDSVELNGGRFRASHASVGRFKVHAAFLRFDIRL